MPASSHISGTIAVANGSTAVAGTGSTWQAARLREGDLFCALGLTVRIASITSNTALVLAEPWPGATLAAGSAYEIRLVDDGVRSLATLNDVLVKINMPADYAAAAEASALAAAQSEADTIAAANTIGNAATEASNSAAAAAQSESAADLHKNAAQQAVADATAQVALAQGHATAAGTQAADAATSATAAATARQQVETIVSQLEGGPVISIVGKTDIVTMEDLEAAGVATTITVNAVQAYADAKVNDRDWSVYAGEPLSDTVALSESSAHQLVQNYTNGAVTNAPDWNAPSTTAAPTVSAAKTYLSAQLAAMVNSAPEALDQLNELAAAMGNDPNFATTMVNSLATKQPLDANVTSINSRVYAAGQMLFWTADKVTDVVNTKAYGRSLLDLEDEAAARASLGVYSIGEVDDELLTKADAATTYTQTQVDDAIAAAIASAMNSAIPAGAVQAFARKTAPTGWLVADGTVVAVDSYPDLVAAIYCGDTDNPTAAFGYRCTNPASPGGTRSISGPYIMLPDLRGEFVRGVDNGRGKDAGRVFGSAQADDIRSHAHTGSTATAGSHSHSGSTTTNGSHNHTASTGTAGAHTHTSTVAGGPTASNTATGGSADRVTNVNNTASSTGSAGDHSHSVTVNYGGDHTHTLSINAGGDHSHTLSINSTGGTETRPPNVALLYCIKH